MRYAPFITTVEQVAGIERQEAERAVEATLRTLAERITRGEADDVAAFLPRELQPLMTHVPEPAEGFDAQEFTRRVAEREGVDDRTAAEHARAVFTALGMAVAPGELRDMAAQLPDDFEAFLQAAGLGRRRVAAGDFIGEVAEIASLDREQAQKAIEAVLQTLAVRISSGEVDDLERELPTNLRPALERGLAERAAATPMSPDEFVARVAQLEGVGQDEAERHTRAVFATLRKYISSKEFEDMSAQLSADYAPLLAPV